MRLVIVTTLCVLVAMASAGEDAPRHYDLSLGRVHFEKFMQDFNRTYKDEDDKELHYQAFIKNLEKINKMNEQSTSATYGINKFADYTEEERKSMFGFKPPKKE